MNWGNLAENFTPLSPFLPHIATCHIVAYNLPVCRCPQKEISLPKKDELLPTIAELINLYRRGPIAPWPTPKRPSVSFLRKCLRPEHCRQTTKPLKRTTPLNIRYSWPQTTEDDEAILLPHGLNERNWNKYLTWAHSDQYGKAGHPFSIIHRRSPASWSTPRLSHPC